jgi:hypothetical protein
MMAAPINRRVLCVFCVCVCARARIARTARVLGEEAGSINTHISSK